MDEDLIKKADIQKISSEGEKIYIEIKSKYEPQHNGKFLAIETDSKDVYLADDSIEAVETAKKVHPDKVFYVVKIGFDYAETLANYFVEQSW